MKSFLKPNKRKIILTILLLILFVFLGAFHIQICKLPPCATLPIYSTIIGFITLWPMLIIVVAPSSQLLQIFLFLLVPFYYYLLACLWFYKKNDWKIKNYILLIVAFLVILFSLYAMFIG
jgi:hypothetical protein